MSTPLPMSTSESVASPAVEAREPAPAPRRGLPAWTREPLLHFLLLGALLFALDRWLVAQRDDPHTIVVSAAVDDEATSLFRASRGRDPDEKELNALRRAWLDNEILYREGLALQVDRGDTAIRERVIFKSLSMLEANLKRPPVDDATLRQWFETNRARYDEPARFDFEEAVMAGAADELRARALVDRLNRGEPGHVDAGLRVFKGRPHANVVDSYGEEFAVELQRAADGEWRALRAKDGWHVVRLRGTSPAVPADFDALQGVVLQDWTDAVMAEQRTAAVRALGEKYRIRYEGTQR